MGMFRGETQRQAQGPLAGLVVTTSGLGRKLDLEFERMVEELGGEYLAAFDPAQVNVLVAVKPDSSRAREAATTAAGDVQVVQPLWLERCYATKTLEPYEPFRLKCFHNCVITSTGLPNEKDILRSFITENGGEYDKELKQSCTHLVAGKPEGNKYLKAIEHGIEVVKPQWVYDSVSMGYPSPVENFRLTPAPPRVTGIGETSEVQNDTARNAEPAAKEEEVDDDDDECEDDDEDPILGGCTAYLHGFQEGAKKQMHSRLLGMGAMTRGSVDHAVTHVVVADRVIKGTDSVEPILDLYKDTGAQVVSEAWVAESRKSKVMSDPTSFTLEERKQQLDDTPRPSSSLNKKRSLSGTLSTVKEDSFYKKARCDGPSSNADAPEGGRAGGAAEKANVFRGKKLFLFGFDAELGDKIRHHALRHGAVECAGMSEADYVVTPHALNVKAKVSESRLVSKDWVKHCMIEKTILRPSENALFRPLPGPIPRSYMKKLSLCISQYVDPERSWMVQLAEILGAECSEVLNRHVTTHVVSLKAEGSKYKKAQEWGIPVVHGDWLNACARSTEPVDASQYLVSDEPKPSRSRHPVPPGPTLSNIAPPKFAVQSALDEIDAMPSSSRRTTSNASSLGGSGRQGSIGRQSSLLQSSLESPDIVRAYGQNLAAANERIKEEFPSNKKRESSGERNLGADMRNMLAGLVQGSKAVAASSAAAGPSPAPDQVHGKTASRRSSGSPMPVLEGRRSSLNAKVLLGGGASVDDETDSEAEGEGSQRVVYDDSFVRDHGRATNAKPSAPAPPQTSRLSRSNALKREASAVGAMPPPAVKIARTMAPPAPVVQPPLATETEPTAVEVSPDVQATLVVSKGTNGSPGETDKLLLEYGLVSCSESDEGAGWVFWEPSNDKVTLKGKGRGSKRIFVVTGGKGCDDRADRREKDHQKKERAELCAAIADEKLGEVEDDDLNRATHVVAVKPSRTAKYLHGVAMGKPIVTPDYIRTCASAGGVAAVDQMGPPLQFTWGYPRDPCANKEEAQLHGAGPYWMGQIHGHKRNWSYRGATIVLWDGDREVSARRAILEACGANVHTLKKRFAAHDMPTVKHGKSSIFVVNAGDIERKLEKAVTPELLSGILIVSFDSIVDSLLSPVPVICVKRVDAPNNAREARQDSKSATGRAGGRSPSSAAPSRSSSRRRS